MKRINDLSGAGLGVSLTEDVAIKITEHRNEHLRLMTHKLFSALISSIKYEDFDIQVDPHLLEHYLRCGRDIVIGETTLGTLCILGFDAKGDYPVEDPDFFGRSLIQFTIDPSLRLPVEKYKMISEADNCETGNYIVITNSYFTNYPDLHSIRHYARKLAEIEGSRLSLAIQAKMLTFFKGDPDDETTNQIISAMLNGQPIIKLAEFMEVDEMIGTIENAGVVAQNLVTLKQEYNTVLAECCQNHGINSYGLAKESGVSDSEVNANNELVLSILHSYVNSRQMPLNRLNKRYGKNIKVYHIEDLQGGENKNDNDNNNDSMVPEKRIDQSGVE